MIDSSIFRAYDIRGIVGETLNEDVLFALGRALGSYVLDEGERLFYVARDGRLSGPVLEEALVKGVLASGCDVIRLGAVPTPVLYYACHVHGLASGVMLTGSHNPSNYNGLKMVVKGVTLAEEAIMELRDRIHANRFHDGEGVSHHLCIQDAYLAAALQNIHLKRSLKIVVDAGNGVAGELAPKLFRALSCDVMPLFCEIDGHFPNHHPDPSEVHNLEALIAKVQECKADVGFAFDGDGDRLGVVTPQGKIIWPDRLLMLFAEALLRASPNATIIYDVKCTKHLAGAIQARGGVPLMWKTGHSLIKAKIRECGALLAGEMSGHFFFNDRWYGFDDALYAGARLLEILASHQESLDDIFARIPNSVNTPELRVAVTEHSKFKLMDELKQSLNFAGASDISLIDGIRVHFANGWGLVRPSNTSPYLIMRFEADDQHGLHVIQDGFRAWLLQADERLELPF